MHTQQEYEMALVRHEGLEYTHAEGACAPRAPTTNFGDVGQRREYGLVSQRNINNAVMSEGAQGCNHGGFLASSRSGGGDENPTILAPVSSCLPDLAGAVPESLPLCGEVSVPGRDPKQEAIILAQDVGRDDWNITRLGRGVHLAKHFIRESFLDPTEVLVRSPRIRKRHDDSLDRSLCQRMCDEESDLLTGTNLPFHLRPRCQPSRREQVCERGCTWNTGSKERVSILLRPGSPDECIRSIRRVRIGSRTKTIAILGAMIVIDYGDQLLESDDGYMRFLAGNLIDEVKRKGDGH